MSETEMFLARKPYGLLAFFGIHSLMLVTFLVLEASGFHFPVGSSLFYFMWIAIWLMHGLSLMLLHIRDREVAAGDPVANSRFWRRMVLGAHSSLYVAFGPLIILWWLMMRQPGPQQPGEGQGLWIYPVWLMVLLAHSAYVMMRDRQAVQKPKRFVPSLKRLMEADSDDYNSWEDDADFDQKNKR